MSRNAIAIRSSESTEPVQTLRSVLPTAEVQRTAGTHSMGSRIRELRDLILGLLQEVEDLEHDELFAEMTTERKVPRLDLESGIKFDDVVRQFETNIIRQALLITGGNQARAARLLGIKANTLNYKIKAYNI